MGICESNKNQNQNQNETSKNIQTPKISQNTQVVETPQNKVTHLEQNINTNTKINTNNTNTVSGAGEDVINKQVSNNLEDIDLYSNRDRNISLGSSINMDDSIGCDQTRNTYAD